MQPNPKSSWWRQTSSAAVARDPATALLVVRLSLSVNALRAQHRWSVSLMRGSDAVNQSDFMQSFVTAVSYTREALNILTGTNRRPGQAREVRALAEHAGVRAEIATAISRLSAGTRPASAMLIRVRNQLGFHWDPDVLMAGVEAVTADEPVLWAEGRAASEGAMVYRFAADVLVNALLPGIAQQSEADAKARVAQAVNDVTDAMNAVVTYFALAIAGHLAPHDFDLRTRWFHRPLEVFRRFVTGR